MQRKFMAAGLVLAAFAGAATAQTSTFDSDAEGWGTINDARNFTWTDEFGNPGGSIRASDIGNGQIWYYSAPSIFLGDRSSLYGESLNWDILGIVGNQTSVDRADVMLAGGGMLIGLDVSVLPLNSDWTSWSALMDESAGWRSIASLTSGSLTGGSISEADIRAVLADLSGLYIRGEYTSGGDSTAIDNVSVVPAPGAAALLGLGALGATRRKRS